MQKKTDQLILELRTKNRRVHRYAKYRSVTRMEVAMAGDTSALWLDCKSVDLNGEERGKWVCCFGIDV